MLYGARPVRAACLGTPVLTCNTDISGTGVVNGGITVTGPTTTTVNVDNLSARANTITPASGTSGIVFSSTTTPINSGTITFGVPVNINATGTNADGINASGSTSTVQAITITSNGNISATRYGIFAQRSGTAASPVTVTSNGNITVSTSGGIQAQATAGSVTISSTGNIRSATNASGTPTGTTANIGILGVNTGANAISTTNNGSVDAFSAGIAARTSTDTHVSHSSLPAITCRLKSVLGELTAVAVLVTLVALAISTEPEALGRAKTRGVTIPEIDA